MKTKILKRINRIEELARRLNAANVAHQKGTIIQLCYSIKERMEEENDCN